MTRRRQKTAEEEEINWKALNATLNRCNLTEEAPAK